MDNVAIKEAKTAVALQTNRKVCDYGRLLYGGASLLLIIFGWQAVAWGVDWWRGAPFPTPFETAWKLLKMLSGEPFLGHSIYLHTLSSMGRWLSGFSIAVIGGALIGMAAGRWRTFERLIMPSVQVLQLIPGLAWIPVAILLFGIGDASTLFMIAVTAFSPIAINVAGGVKRVDEMYIRAARMLGLNNRMLFRTVLLPGALPHILSGLRVGLGSSWRVLVAAEMVVGRGTGLGYAIIQSRWTLDFAKAFVCIAIICVIGLIVEQVIFIPLERRTIELWGLKREV
ncbi:ABC transporter permease [uncultured Desulfuromusa sp.]|uniref:ABC transporter permease n=1 Tax=uncultured Desulfuromusa sp. TaxID=219183 RepID=UPI002AA96294|nr:ABC transporter permease [uncultured Desulfuromusa sp.]